VLLGPQGKLRSTVGTSKVVRRTASGTAAAADSKGGRVTPRVTDALDRWLVADAAREPEQERRREDEDPIFEQLDALHDERVERGDPFWSPRGPDPQALERLVEDRRARGVLRSASQFDAGS
jgi:hypothetical protein